MEARGAPPLLTRAANADHDNGQADAKPCERDIARFGNMSDIDAVHQIVEHIDQLCNHGGEGKAEEKPAEGLFCEKSFVLFHVHTSENLCKIADRAPRHPQMVCIGCCASGAVLLETAGQNTVLNVQGIPQNAL